MKHTPNDHDDDELGDIIDSIKKSVKADQKKPDKPHNTESHKAQEKAIQNEIASGHLDYYKIVGAKPTDSQTTINKLCNIKLAEFHPDKIGRQVEKYPLEDREKQRSRYNREYELIREAVKYLKDADSRKLYDSKKEKGEAKSFVDHKQTFDSFMKLQDVDISDETRQLKTLGFEKGFSEMNAKHGFDPKKVGNKLSEPDLSRRLGDLRLERDQQSVECMKKKLFDGNFDDIEFNRKFEMDKKKRDRRRKVGGDRSIIKCDGIAAANGFGDGSNYVSIGEDGEGYEDLYLGGGGGDGGMYATRLGSDDDESIGSLDDELIGDIDVSYVRDHGKDKHKTEKTYEEYMREREKDTMQFDGRAMHDSTWGSIESNAFNISAQVGSLIGSDMLHANDDKTKKNRAEMMDAYKALRFRDQN